MRVLSLLRCTVFVLPIGSPILLHSATVDSTPVLAQASQAFSAGKPVTSVVMTGTAQWFAGSQKDSGPVKMSANVNGENSIELDLGGGTGIETQSAITDDRTCTWSGKDGVSHDMASSNCWTATIWFLPHLALQATGQPTNLSVQYQAASASATQGSVPHLQHQLTVAPGKTSAAVTALIRAWSRTDLALDSATFLPSVLKYSIHPDSNSSVNLQVEVRYSNYQNVSGVELPMHIERYVNGSLQLSIDVASATVN